MDTQIKIRCEYSRLVPVDELKPHPKNPKKHSKEAIERQAIVLEYQGWRRPITVSNRSGVMTAGHKRLLAAKLRGWKEVPVSFQDYDSEEQEIADLVADNALNEWELTDLGEVNNMLADLDGANFNVDWLGIKDFELEPADKYGDKDADAMPEQRTTDIKLGDLFQLGNHRLLCGDSTDALQVQLLMNGEKADMVFTDPPYGIDIYSKGSFHDGKQHGKALAAHNKYRPVEGDKDLKCVEFLFKWLINFEGIAIVWGANNFPQFCTPSNGWLVWDKKQHANHGDCEIAWTNVDKAIRMFSHQWVGFQRDSERGEKRVHPTQKPVALAAWAFEVWDSPKAVLDLFLGSGSTLIACEKTNRKCYGMEIDPQYCQVIIDRWEKFSGQKAVKL